MVEESNKRYGIPNHDIWRGEKVEGYDIVMIYWASGKENKRTDILTVWDKSWNDIFT